MPFQNDQPNNSWTHFAKNTYTNTANYKALAAKLFPLYQGKGQTSTGTKD